jgi:MscS family membrane protein
MKWVVLLLTLLIMPAQAGVVTTATVANEHQSKSTASSKLSSLTLSTPQVTVLQFLNAMQRVAQGDDEAMAEAISTLDLSKINAVIRSEKGPEIARLLYRILEVKGINSAAHIRMPEDNQSVILLGTDDGNVVISFNTHQGWQFSAETVGLVPTIFQSLTQTKRAQLMADEAIALPVNVQVRAAIPEFLKEGFLLEYWQWIGLFLIVVIGSIADKALAWILKLNVSRWRKSHPSFESLDADVLRPLGLMAMALMWWSGLNALGLPDSALVVLLVAVKLLVSISGIWSAFRLVDIFDAYCSSRAALTENKFDDLLVPMITKSVKVFVVVMGIIFAADNLNIDVTSLLAGLGLGGLAFALAAKDLLGNFFGSITVLLDRPFSIGDWVVIGDIEGIVEQVGFRSTRIRTFDSSLITMPNSILTTTKIDNMGARPYRRMKTLLSLTYDTSPEKIEAFCAGIRHLVERHPHMRKDYYQVYFNQYGADSLGILVYVFWTTPDWATELKERHRFLLDILRLAKQLGVEFAFPTQTLYLRQDAPMEATTDAYQMDMSRESAISLGRDEAEAILKQTLDASK